MTTFVSLKDSQRKACKISKKRCYNFIIFSSRLVYPEKQEIQEINRKIKVSDAENKNRLLSVKFEWKSKKAYALCSKVGTFLSNLEIRSSIHFSGNAEW